MGRSRCPLLTWPTHVRLRLSLWPRVEHASFIELFALRKVDFVSMIEVLTEHCAIGTHAVSLQILETSRYFLLQCSASDISAVIPSTKRTNLRDLILAPHQWTGISRCASGIICFINQTLVFCNCFQIKLGEIIRYLTSVPIFNYS